MAAAIATPTGSAASFHETSAFSARGQTKMPQPPRTPQAGGNPSTPPLSQGSQKIGNIRPGAPRKQTSTLQRTRGVAEPMSEMPGAPDKDRPRLAAQAPAMTSIA